MTPLNRILILYAHPAPKKSKINRELIKAVRDLPGVTVWDLYEAYPNLEIDVAHEKKLLLNHDIIVFQHPFYWYSTPAILKEWTDLVLEYGFAYGRGGEQLKGKVWLQAITAGGSEHAYSAEGHNRYRVRQFLAPMEQSAHLCQMPFLPPFVIYETLRLSVLSHVSEISKNYRDLMILLRDSKVNWNAVPKWERINDRMEELRKLQDSGETQS